MTIACCGTAVCVDKSKPVHDTSTPRSNGTTDCSRYRTCTECTTAEAACSWSLVKQNCNVTAAATTTTSVTPVMSSTKTPSTATRPPTTEQVAPLQTSSTVMPDVHVNDDDDPLMVYSVLSCPVYSVNYTKKTDIESVTHTVKLNVSNDPTGAFAVLLNRSSVTCELLEKSFPAAITADGGQIACEIREHTTPENATDGAAVSDRARPSVVYFAVIVDGVPLEFDNLTDHYMTVYHNSCDAGQRSNAAECVNCVWEDDERRRYYCRWCPRNNVCTGLYQHCDVRKPNNGSYVPDHAVDNVNVRCPAIRIDSISPVYGPWAGGTTMRIVVSNHRTIAENKLIKVTVAGYRCLLPTASADGTTVECTISAVNSSRLDDGPVEVTYVSDHDKSVPALTLRSDQTFYFVDPEITNVRPNCGNVSGGTEITIRGNFLNAGNRLKVFVRENIPCAITSHGHNDVTCVTGAVDSPGAGRVKLEFDHYLNKYVPYPVFEYTSDPTLDDNQTFSGIASGGTRLPVRGRHFSCIQNPLMFVVYKAMRHTGVCRVHNDTYMVCTTPRVNRPAPRSVTRLQYGFQADFDKHIVTLNSTGYVLYPDPVYTDFDTDDGDGDRTLTINGQHLDRGYQLTDDLSVRLRGSGTACNVSSVESRRVVCRLQPTRALARGAGSMADVEHDAIVVSVGSNLIYDVKRKFVNRNHSMILTVVFGGITVVSLIITLVVAVVYCTKIALMASSQHPTEMQSLCEQLQSTATIGQEVEPLSADRKE